MSESTGNNVLVPDSIPLDGTGAAPAFGAEATRHKESGAGKEVGDRERFEQLFRDARPRIYRLAYAQLHNSTDAEDITQETFVRAWINFSSFDGTRPFMCWAMRIATNLAIDCRRRRKRWPTFSLDTPQVLLETEDRLSDVADPARDPVAAIIANQLNETVLRAVLSLSANHRESIAWLVEDYSYKEIAEMMQCPVGTVRSRIHRARIQLRHAITTIMQNEL